MKRKNRIIIILLILILSFLPLMAEDGGGNPNKRGKEETSLSKIKKEITEEKEKLKRAEKEEKALLRRLNSLEKQIYATENRIVQLNQRLKEVNKEIGALESELMELNRNLTRHQKSLSDRLQVMYRARHLGYLETILTSSDFASLIRRTYFMRLIAMEDAKLIQQVREGIKVIAQRRDELRAKQEELDRLRRTEEVAKSLRESQRKSRKALLAKVRQQKSLYLLRIKELEEASRRIKRMITRLEREKGSPTPITPELLRLKNQLAWPIDGGKVLQGFGPYLHPKFGTQAINKGIHIEAPYGQVVRSVLDGKVVYADYFKGYGQLAMVDHGGGLYSLYAHLAQISVKNGQRISQGGVIGTVGTSESGEGGLLHFELRVNGEPVDPLEWLKRR